MTTTATTATAQIYQFPLRGRYASQEQERATATERYARVSIGSSWYHEEAIQEERSRKN